VPWPLSWGWSAMLWIKVCGISTLPAAVAALRAGANAVGFVFWPGSRRYLEPRRASALSAALPPGFGRVGVFVDQLPEQMERVAEVAHLTHLQLHGSEEPEMIPRLSLPVIKAVRIGGPQDLGQIERYAWVPNCWAVLVEPYLPNVAGGAGLPLDRELARCARELAKSFGCRFILSGGLGPENVAQAVTAVAPDGVDVSSGVETNGLKDSMKIFAFVAAVRGF
jgi:phosphoribosylanthranilate isomerase